MQDIEIKTVLSMGGFALLVVLGLLSSEYRRSGNAAGAVAAMIGGLFRKKRLLPSEGHGLAIAAGSRLVTIFAEASFDPVRKTGSWALWARCGTRKLEKAGSLKGRLHTRDHASLAALGLAVRAAVDEFGLHELDTVLAQSASEHAIDVLSGRLPLHDNRVDEQAILHEVRLLGEERGLRLVFKHLHDPGGDSSRRTLASVRCEQAAERELERAAGAGSD